MVSGVSGAGQVLEFSQSFIRRASCSGFAGFRQSALAGFLGGIPVLRLMLCRHLERAEVVNIRSRFIPDEIIFRSRLRDILKEKLNLATIIDKVSQTARVVQYRQFFQLPG
jgi:hypothetical protein